MYGLLQQDILQNITDQNVRLDFCGANQTGDVFFIISKIYIININNLTQTIFNNYFYMYIFNE